MKKTLATRWVKALRSGKYEQGKGALKQENGKYCCLGVLCDLMKIPSELKEYQDNEKLYYFSGGEQTVRDTSPLVLPRSVKHKAGMKSNTGSLNGLFEAFQIEGNYYTDLAEANDGGCTFEQLADFIEQHYEEL